MAQGASQKEVGRSYRAIEKYLQEGGGKEGAGTQQPQSVGVMHVSKLLRRFCSALGIGHTPSKYVELFGHAACPENPR